MSINDKILNNLTKFLEYIVTQITGIYDITRIF